MTMTNLLFLLLGVEIGGIIGMLFILLDLDYFEWDELWLLPLWPLGLLTRAVCPIARKLRRLANYTASLRKKRGKNVAAVEEG